MSWEDEIYIVTHNVVKNSTVRLSYRQPQPSVICHVTAGTVFFRSGVRGASTALGCELL